MRSLPVKSFLAENLHGWALPISSVNDDNMLTAMGLTSAERNAIEGLRNAARTVDGTLETEEEQSARAVALLAVNPPPQVGKLQKLTAKWLLRPCEQCRSNSGPWRDHRERRALLLMSSRAFDGALADPLGLRFSGCVRRDLDLRSLHTHSN